MRRVYLEIVDLTTNTKGIYVCNNKKEFKIYIESFKNENVKIYGKIGGING